MTTYTINASWRVFGKCYSADYKGGGKWNNDGRMEDERYSDRDDAVAAAEQMRDQWGESTTIYVMDDEGNVVHSCTGTVTDA